MTVIGYCFNMAMALASYDAERADEWKTLSDTALAFIKRALTFEETGQSEEALLHYEEGLRLLDKALAIPPAESGSTNAEAKMSRTRQQVAFRIHELTPKSAVAEACGGDEGTDFPSDAEILFSIMGRVQIFFINVSGSVSAPSYPGSLLIFKFKNDPNSPAFLKVGNWVYPLVRGKSPILRSNEGAYLFPDLDDSIAGNAIGLVFPSDILEVEKQQFEAIVNELTCLPDDLKEYDDCIQYSQQISAGLLKGAELIGAGMVKGAIKSSEWMYLGTEKLKAKISPEEQPRQVDPRLKASLGAARWLSGNTVKASSYVVTKAGAATVALGKFLAPHIRNHSTKALSHIIEQSDEKSQKQLNIATELAGGTIVALTTVYSALENSSRILATNLANNTVQVVSHKYGNDVGTATEHALTSAGNAYLTAYNASALGLKPLVKRAAKTTGKLAVGVPEEAILGRRDAKVEEETTKDTLKAIEYEDTNNHRP